MQFSGLVGQLSAVGCPLTDERLSVFPKTRGFKGVGTPLGLWPSAPGSEGKKKILKMDGDFTSRVLV